MVNSKKFDEVFVGDECIKLPTPFKREREWFRINIRHLMKIIENLEKNSGGCYWSIFND